MTDDADRACFCTRVWGAHRRGQCDGLPNGWARPPPDIDITPQQIKDGIAAKLRQRDAIVRQLDGEVAALRALCPHPTSSLRSAMGETWTACDFCGRSL